MSHGILWANLIFLFCLSLFPFATLWVGAKGLTHFSAAMYATVSMLPGISYGVLALRVRRLSDAPAHSSWFKQGGSVLLYAIAIPAAYLNPVLSLVLLSIVATVWLLPPRGDAACQQIQETLHHKENPHSTAAPPAQKG